MFERSIERVFQQMADQQQPQSRVSIQQALRDGRTRLRRRRLMRAVGTPAVAAAAVLAIALPASMSAGRHGAGPHSPIAASTATARHFSAYSAYAGFGWLPAGSALTDGAFSTRFDYLSAGPWTLFAGAAGECHLGNREFTCPSSPLAMTGTSPAPEVNGHQAYWSLDLPPLVKHRSVIGLIWQYKSGSWAMVSGGPGANKQKLRHIASTVTFGRHHPSLRFAVKLTGLPADWQIEEADFEHPLSVKWAYGFVITNGRERLTVTMALAPDGPNACPEPMRDGASCRVIHGYHVAVSPIVRNQGEKAPRETLTAYDAAGLSMQITVTGRMQPLSTVALFSDMTILGTNPADWTTIPIR